MEGDDRKKEEEAEERRAEGETTTGKREENIEGGQEGEEEEKIEVERRTEKGEGTKEKVGHDARGRTKHRRRGDVDEGGDGHGDPTQGRHRASERACKGEARREDP